MLFLSILIQYSFPAMTVLLATLSTSAYFHVLVNISNKSIFNHISIECTQAIVYDISVPTRFKVTTSLKQKKIIDLFQTPGPQ